MPGKHELWSIVKSSLPLRRVTQVGVVGALVLGVSGVAVMDKSVALSVDGQESSARAFGGTVGDVLEKKGITLGEHDTVTPSVGTKIEDGQTIVVRYGRKLVVTIDGKEREYWTTATTVGDAMRELGIRGEGARLSASRSQALGRDGLEMTMVTPKDVKLVVGGEKAKKVSTTELTVSEALKALEVRHDSNDLIKPGRSTKIKDGMTIRVDAITKASRTVNRTIPFQTVTKEDASLAAGTTKVEREGKAGTERVTLRVTTKNGKAVKTTEVKSTVTAKPVSKVVIKGTKPAPKPATTSRTSTRSSSQSAPPKQSSSSTSGSGLNLANAAMWDRIAQCESTGRWNINTGNGYYGGLQFDIRTWLSVGGADFAPRADLATRAEQITVANRLYAQRGLQPWGCAHAA